MASSSPNAAPVRTSAAAVDRAPKSCVVPVDPDAAAKKAEMLTQPRSTATLDPADDTRIFADMEKQRLRLLALHPDLSGLCAEEIAASWLAPAKTVAAAVAGSSLVVWGRLDAVETPAGLVTATVTVLRARPGDLVGRTVTVHLSYGVSLAGSPDSLVVTPEPGSPVLTAGDRAVLLLKRDGPVWATVPGGELPVDDGRIDSSARAFQGSMKSRVSPFGAEVDGLTPVEFFTRFDG